MLPPWSRDLTALLAGLTGTLTFSTGLALTYLRAGALPGNLILLALICAVLATTLGRYDPEQIRIRHPRTSIDPNIAAPPEDTR